LPFLDSALCQIISVGGWHQGGGERPLGALFAKAFHQSVVVDSVLHPEPAGGGLEMRQQVRVGQSVRWRDRGSLGVTGEMTDGQEWSLSPVASTEKLLVSPWF
jgi:hypothetical protein